MKVCVSALIATFVFLGVFSTAVVFAGAETAILKHGYEVLIQGTRRDGDAIAKEHDFFYALNTSSGRFVCGPDHVILYDVHDATLFFAERMIISVRPEFDKFGTKVEGVKIYNDMGTVCQKGTIVVP